MCHMTCVMCALSMQVFDQYLNFISLEDDFFVVRQQQTKAISYHGRLCVCVMCGEACAVPVVCLSLPLLIYMCLSLNAQTYVYMYVFLFCALMLQLPSFSSLPSLPSLPPPPSLQLSTEQMRWTLTSRQLKMSWWSHSSQFLSLLVRNSRLPMMLQWCPSMMMYIVHVQCICTMSCVYIVLHCNIAVCCLGNL